MRAQIVLLFCQAGSIPEPSHTIYQQFLPSNLSHTAISSGSTSTEGPSVCHSPVSFSVFVELSNLAAPVGSNQFGIRPLESHLPLESTGHSKVVQEQMFTACMFIAQELHMSSSSSGSSVWCRRVWQVETS